MVSRLPFPSDNTGQRLRLFLDAFAEFPQLHFIWKLDPGGREKVLKDYPNVFAFSWTQQASILGSRSSLSLGVSADNRTLAFVSHMGVNSFIEASLGGVPIVAIPLFNDQHYNTAVALDKGTAVYLHRSQLSKQRLVDALKEVVYNERFASLGKKPLAATARPRPY